MASMAGIEKMYFQIFVAEQHKVCFESSGGRK